MKLSKNQELGGLVSILIVMFIWGSAFSVSKLGVSAVPPFLFAFLRNLVASLFLIPFYLYKRKRAKLQPLPPRFYQYILLMGLTGVCLFYIFFNLAMTYMSASTGAIVQGITPAVIAIPAVFFLKEKLDGITILGIVLSIAGVVLVGFVHAGNSESSTAVGSILMILSVACWATYTIVSKSIHTYDAIVITALSTFTGTVFLIPAVVIELWGRPVPAISWQGWASIVYLGVFASAISYILYNRALKTLTAAQVGNFLNLDPVIGVIIAILFLKEKISGWQVVGGVLVLVGIWLSSAKKNEKVKIKNSK